MIDEQYYLTEVLKPGSSLYYALRWTEPAKRQAIAALFTLGQTLKFIPLDCSDTQVARQKLSWWRIECERLQTGNPTHPLLQTLLPIINQYALPAAIFSHCVDMLELHLDKREYIDLNELEDYYLAIQQIEASAIKVTADNADIAADYSKQLSLAWQYSFNLQYFRKIALRRQYRFTQEEISQLDLNAISALRMTESLKAWLAKQAHYANAHYQQALQLLPLTQRYSQLPFLIFTKLQLKLLEEIEKDGWQIFTHQLELTPLRKLWLAWRIRKLKQASLKVRSNSRVVNGEFSQIESDPKK